MIHLQCVYCFSNLILSYISSLLLMIGCNYYCRYFIDYGFQFWLHCTFNQLRKPWKSNMCICYTAFRKILGLSLVSCSICQYFTNNFVKVVIDMRRIQTFFYQCYVSFCYILGLLYTHMFYWYSSVAILVIILDDDGRTIREDAETKSPPLYPFYTV